MKTRHESKSDFFVVINITPQMQLSSSCFEPGILF